MQKLTLGFSPCPNDTFIFDALIHHKIDTEDLSFEVVLGDVEELNNKAIAGQLDITKLSYHAYTYVSKNYILLNSGSALGNNCGPLLIAKEQLSEVELRQATIAIPGEMTTANFLFGIFYPNVKQKTSVLFSDIEDSVISGKFDAGVIIHENRFTYHDKGLVKICDLGQRWEETANCPIPLGGIAIKRDIPFDIQKKVDRLIKESIAFAFNNPKSSLPYIKQHAQEMQEEVMYKHIDLYVNQYSVDLGEKGKMAIKYLFETGLQNGLIDAVKEPYIL